MAKRTITATATIMHGDSWVDFKKNRSYINIIMELDKRNGYDRVGVRYHLGKKNDIRLFSRLAKIVGEKEQLIDPGDLLTKELRVVVKVKNNELELFAFGYVGVDLFYLHNQEDTQLYTLAEVLDMV